MAFLRFSQCIEKSAVRSSVVGVKVWTVTRLWLDISALEMEMWRLLLVFSHRRFRSVISPRRKNRYYRVMGERCMEVKVGFVRRHCRMLLDWEECALFLGVGRFGRGGGSLM